MIYLVVITLWLGSGASAAGTSEGWVSGKYDWHHGRYPTIAACEAARIKIIAFAKTRSQSTLVSKCGAHDDLLELRSYSADGPDSPKVQS